MLGILFLLIFLTLELTKLGSSRLEKEHITLACAVVIVCAEIYAIYRILKYDKALCRQIGFVCPHCSEPLYRTHALIFRTGKCPACKAVISDF